MSADETRELVERWRARAKHLEQTAATYRKMGDADYAEDLEQAAADTYRDAARLEATL